MGLEDNRKIILVTGGDGGYGNLGDEWLADSVRARYKKIKQKYRVIFLMQCPKADNDGFIYCLDNKDSFEKMCIPIKDIMAVHFYGGGYINDYWMDEKLWLYDFLAEKGMPDKKIFFTGVGMGPISKEKLEGVKKIAKNVNFFGIRDRSFRFLVKSRFTFDESILFAPELVASEPDDKKILVNFRMADHVGINVDNIGKLLNSIYLASEQRRMVVEYFPMIDDVWFDERKEMEKVLKNNNILSKVKNRPKDYIELYNLIRKASLIATTSYHVALASLYLGKPVVAVYGNEYYKIKYTNLKKVFPSKLLKIVNVEKLNIKTVNEHIGTTDINQPKIIKKLRTASDLAYQDYENYLNINGLSK